MREPLLVFPLTLRTCNQWLLPYIKYMIEVFGGMVNAALANQYSK